MYSSVLVRITYLALAIALGLPWAAKAQRCDPPAGRAASVQGTVELRRAGTTQWQPVALNDELCPGDTIRALERSRADVMLLSQSVLRIRANTTLTLEGIRDEQSYFADLLQGAVHFFSRQGDRNLEVNTPFTVVGVRGTEFYVAVEADRTLLTVFEGRVLASNAAGSLTLRDGQSAVAARGSAPQLRVVARPRDAVQWAIYYLPVVDVRPDAFQGRVRESAQYYLQGDLQRAFDSLEGVPDGDDPRFLTYRATLLLAVGSVDEAQADIERALARSANDSNALALQTIIAIARNENERALEVARRAVQADPDSASALIALSYAQQSSFDLDGARGSLERAVQQEPENALAWARLAEIRSSFGNLSDALAAAQEAARLQPNLSRTQTVLGFAYLTQVKTDQAKAAFERAITLDQADPLSRLGLGLAKIREGDLEAGGRDIEVAASLDSSNSLIRSYLGKTYYEEKREGQDDREYAMAKQLDPNDPTPWFYSAIAKQTTNRPVEALRDIQNAVELNDNRAVYRSQLLLDSDLAARSSSQARIYSDLGFQHLALVEGWHSVNTDPTNFSAHRLLADSYAARPRHGIARVSELLQSQLLQPSNLTPIQPRLAESSLFQIAAQGPASLSFTEFNPLFNRDRVAVQASGGVAEDDTQSGEGIVSGVYRNLSFSGGYSSFTTDGYRDNNEQKDQIANAFAQVEVGPQTSLQTEYRYRYRENGDLETRFFEGDFRPFADEQVRQRSIRGGLRHAFSPNATVLASYIYQKKDSELEDALPAFGVPLIKVDRDEKAQSSEAQFIYRSDPLGWLNGLIKSVNVTSGAGYFDVDVDETTIQQIILLPPPFPPITVITPLKPDVEHTNWYVYSNVSMARNITLTLGVSADYFEQDDGVDDENEVNYKFGLTWNPSAVPGMTVRAAAFKVLKRSLVTAQTLEPTQVAGFNQLYDDANATKAKSWGVAVDQKFSESLYGGLEYSGRDLDVPFRAFGVMGFTTLKEDWDEYTGRAYLFWTPHDWVALSLEYTYEKFERTPDIPFAFEEVKTHRVPLGIRFFHPSGVSASLKATYQDQDGDFENRTFPFIPRFISDDDNFWVVDAAIRYRLPKRYGFVTPWVGAAASEGGGKAIQSGALSAIGGRQIPANTGH